MAAFVEREISKIGVIGFDTETKPVFSANQASNGPHVVQLATLDRSFLFQTFRTDTLPFLKEVLESPYVQKVGFGLSQDKAALAQKLGIRLLNTRDVSAAFRPLGYRQKVGVKAAVAIVLAQQLEKSKRATRSNWSQRNLTGPQLHYAADDAHAALAVFLALGCPSSQPTQTEPRNVSDEVVEFSGRTARVSGFPPWYVLVFGGFANEAEAGEWLRELRVGLGYLALQHHVALNASFELCELQIFDEPRGIPRLPLASLADGSADGAQPFICPAGLRVRTVAGLPGSVTITQGANFLLHALAEWQSLPDPSYALEDSRLVTALELYSAQLVEPSPQAKFLLLISSLESICVPVPRPPRVAALMGKWRAELQDAIACEKNPLELESLEAVRSELGFRRCNSIARQLRTLVRETLADQVDVDACVARIGELYSQRSQLLHSGRFAGDDQSRIADAQSIARRVLQAKAGFPAVKQRP